MYNNEYFYGITDLMHFNVYASLLKEHIIKEERVIIKVFKKENEIFKAVATALRKKFKGIYVIGAEMSSAPSKFPAVSFVQTNNAIKRIGIIKDFETHLDAFFL